MAKIQLNLISRYTTSVFDEGAAEIAAYDPTSRRLFVVNGSNATIDILDLSDPINPIQIGTINISSLGDGVNSVAIKNGIVAAAIEDVDANDPDIQLPGKVAFFDPNGTLLNQVTVGALPDMLTFSTDGSKVLVANEGEPGGGTDPEGSVSIIDLSGGVANLTQGEVSTADFTAFNGREDEFRARGVRIFPGTSLAEDVEPEYIAISPDGSRAFVTLQENNAIAVVDIESATVLDIVPLGVKDYSRGQPYLTQYQFSNLPTLGTTSGGQTIALGGFSGLYFTGVAANGNLKFVTLPDRGPNGAPTDVDNDGNDERPFALPDYQARVIQFELNETTGVIENLTQTLLFRQDGTTPITGLPNIEGVDEEPVDLLGNGLPYDPLGADMEGIVIDENGNYWMVDEYRPAIYQFNSNGTLLNRFVPDGTAALAGQPIGTFGTETLPAEYSTRRDNRGFEAIALDTDNNILYAFIQTSLANPNRAASDSSDIIRILGIDPTTGEAIAEYIYLLEDPSSAIRPGGRVDKIGDAVYAGDGKFYVVERDAEIGTTAKKYVFEINLTGATNLLANDAPDLPTGTTLEQLATADALTAIGIQAVNKIKVTNLPSLGYIAGDKVEGLTQLPDGRLAILNDNDFGLLDEAIAGDGTVTLNSNPVPIVLGVIDFENGNTNTLDASDRDGAINLANYPIYGLYMPDSVVSYSVNGTTYYITANEGDDRGETARVKDLILDPIAFPNAAALQADEVLGRLNVSTIDGDLDGDGDYDQLFTYGGRSFSIFDEFGNLVFDSGDDFERIIAQFFPDDFNSDNSENASFDSRSDNKGPEPEGVTTGVIDGRTYAFIGLERMGGVMVYDVTNPASPTFVQYINPRDFAGNAEAGTAGDLGPEGLLFISAEDSPTGVPLLIVANEVSGSTAVFEIEIESDDDDDGGNDDDGNDDDGNDDHQATEGRDRLVGGEDDDRLRGLGGNDILRGEGGDDTLLGNDGNDKLVGGDGNDLLKGGNGRDRLQGNNGDDRLIGGKGNDVLDGGKGNDFLQGEQGNDRLIGGRGRDIFALGRKDGTDRITDLEIGRDRIKLLGKLDFEDLDIVDRGDNTLLKAGNRNLAILVGIDSNDVTKAVFR